MAAELLRYVTSLQISRALLKWCRPRSPIEFCAIRLLSGTCHRNVYRQPKSDRTEGVLGLFHGRSWRENEERTFHMARDEMNKVILSIFNVLTWFLMLKMTYKTYPERRSGTALPISPMQCMALNRLGSRPDELHVDSTSVGYCASHLSLD